MGWYTTENLAEYLSVAGDFLWSEPVAHTVPLAIVESLRARGGALYDVAPPRYGWWLPTTDDPAPGSFLQRIRLVAR